MKAAAFQAALLHWMLRADAADGAPAARVAGMLEALDREADAVWMWHLARRMGNAEAGDYVRDFIRDDKILDGGMLPGYYESQKDTYATQVDTTQFDELLVGLKAAPFCEIHRKPEPNREGDYRACGECFHVWRNEAEFADDVKAMRQELEKSWARYEGTPYPRSEAEPSEIAFCPLCSHDF